MAGGKHLSISITGAEELVAKFKLLEGAMPHTVEEATLRAAEVFRDGLRQRVRKRTWRTWEDIQLHGHRATPTGFTVKAGPTSGKGGRAYIAYFLEKGTSKMRAYPFVRPTRDEDTPKALDAAGREIDEAVRRAGLK